MIINNFTYPVIADDDRDPYVSFANHLARKSRGGVDLAYPYGTPVYAPTAGFGRYSEGKGSGGNIYYLDCDEGTIEFMHLIAGGVTGNIREKDYIGLSGGSGYGNNKHYDAHLHVDIETEDGRRNLWDYFSTAPAALDLTELLTELDPALDVYVTAPNKTVCHFSSRGLATFASQEAYKDWRSFVLFYNQNTDDRKLVVPPELEKVIVVTWERYNALCQQYVTA